MLDVIPGEVDWQGHGLEDVGKRSDSRTWCDRPWGFHSKLDSELAALIDEHIQVLVRTLKYWEGEVLSSPI